MGLFIQLPQFFLLYCFLYHNQFIAYCLYRYLNYTGDVGNRHISVLFMKIIQDIHLSVGHIYLLLSPVVFLFYIHIIAVWHFCSVHIFDTFLSENSVLLTHFIVELS